MDFELCIDSIEEAIVARDYGFKRIELCSGLEVGGLTPSYGLISSCVAINGPEVHVMIRPNSGSFVYSNLSFEIMQKNILAVAAANASGVVFGIMDEEGRVDFHKNNILVQLAKSQNLECTFHRAIDTSLDWEADVTLLKEIGFNRILTSGGKGKAIDGIDRIAKMKELVKNDVEIMAGAGVNSSNTYELASKGIDALHFTARIKLEDNSSLGFGSDFQIDKSKIEEILNQF